MNQTFPFTNIDTPRKPPRLKSQQFETGHRPEIREPQLPVTLQSRCIAHGRKTVSDTTLENKFDTNNSQKTHASKAQSLQDHSNDWRFGRISVQSINMLAAKTTSKAQTTSLSEFQVSLGIEGGPNGLAAKGRFEPTELDEEDIGWGMVRLYRDAEETPTLYDSINSSRHSRHRRRGSECHGTSVDRPFRDEDCTTLCILAVPSYLTPSDFLGFVGEETREQVSHFRMIRTEQVNRYMVLMKFRSGKKAREWREEWNGKAFNSMEVR